MKDIIVKYLETDRTYESGVKLFMQIPNASMGFKQTLNRQPCTPYLHQMLLEQLSELAGIHRDEFNDIISRPVTLVAKMEVVPDPPAGDDEGEGNQEVTPEEKAAFITEIPEHVRKSIRLRDEYPFLASPDCPTELKILVHDMLTAYVNYVDGHKRLFEATTGEELQEIAAGVVENYIENHEIWDELNHYKTAGELLGKHAIFAQSARIAEIKAMTTADQVKLQKNLMNNLARTKKNIADHPDHKNTEERKASVAQFEFELSVVNPLLGLDA